MNSICLELLFYASSSLVWMSLQNLLVFDPLENQPPSIPSCLCHSISSPSPSSSNNIEICEQNIKYDVNKMLLINWHYHHLRSKDRFFILQTLVVTSTIPFFTLLPTKIPWSWICYSICGRFTHYKNQIHLYQWWPHHGLLVWRPLKQTTKNEVVHYGSKIEINFKKCSRFCMVN